MSERYSGLPYWAVPCKHGAIPYATFDMVSTGASPFYNDKVPGPKRVVYDCPTPYECAHEAYTAYEGHHDES